jgi:hypothetical protein
VRRLSRVHIPGASGAGPLTPFVPCTLSLFRPIVRPDICQVGPAGDRPLYARYVDGHVTAHVPGRVNRPRRVRRSLVISDTCLNLLKIPTCCRRSSELHRPHPRSLAVCGGANAFAEF